ncbi:Signal transduction response regulator, receiver region domain protein [Candidatus Omnitrophus magneticus]|uniref:Signal transduction response regulator, receiver region domain protein n=1 Tax=Candidatus Omnitrophus magneticus TaxID=1609969 RepID=A0A0F0CK90_9BACT|nr:Signal transduction response regulator, receiver region domain protein [Candidatus Omnitrophus magneticus]
MDTLKNQKKIVVADDNANICELLQTGLERAGYVTACVENGLELINYLKNNQDIDAVILDLVMPERGGISVFETIRSISPASIIIIYTGYTDYKNSVYCRAADAFIEKTDGLARILEVLNELL